MRRGVRGPRLSFKRLRACPGPDPGTNESSGIKQPAERLCKGLPWREGENPDTK